MGLSITKDIATSLTSLIFVVVLIGGLMVSFPFLELGIKHILILFGIVFIISTILNFTQRDNYFKKYVFRTAIVFALAFFLNIPNSSTDLKRFATPIEKKTIENSFIILGNNISLVKDTHKKDSKKILYKFKSIA